MTHPHVYSLYATKAAGDGTVIHRSAGGIWWAVSGDAARGQIAAETLKDGFAIQVLEVKLISEEECARLADYYATSRTAP